jgi:hypothetical protein
VLTRLAHWRLVLPAAGAAARQLAAVVQRRAVVAARRRAAAAADVRRPAAAANMQQVGVCRDFAHLTITFCRSLNIPARYMPQATSETSAFPPTRRRWIFPHGSKCI